jgi:hypothetical protein
MTGKHFAASFMHQKEFTSVNKQSKRARIHFRTTINSQFIKRRFIWCVFQAWQDESIQSSSQYILLQLTS